MSPSGRNAGQVRVDLLVGTSCFSRVQVMHYNQSFNSSSLRLVVRRLDWFEVRTCCILVLQVVTMMTEEGKIKAKLVLLN
jgi:hypothetical protein